MALLFAIPTPHLIALALAAGAAVTDARTGHIPNGITLPPILIAPIVYGIVSGPQMAAMSLLAAVLCAFVPWLMFRKGAAGGGDVKLMAAIGAVAGASFGVETQLFGFVLAATVSLLLLSYRGRLLTTLSGALFLALNPFLPKRLRRAPCHESMSTIRMGIPFFLGGLIATWIRMPSL